MANCMLIMVARDFYVNSCTFYRVSLNWTITVWILKWYIDVLYQEILLDVLDRDNFDTDISSICCVFFCWTTKANCFINCFQEISFRSHWCKCATNSWKTEDKTLLPRVVCFILLQIDSIVKFSKNYAFHFLYNCHVQC